MSEGRATNRSSRSGRRAASVTLVVCLVGLFAANPSAHAAPTVTGVVYRDLDNDGIRDANEPGIPGIVLSAGVKFALTKADGTYDLTFSGVQRVRVVTGWYRTQCSKVTCPIGAVDNDFMVNNQFIIRDGVDAAVGAQLNVGLIPDWPGGYPQPLPPIASNTVDVSARASWITPSVKGSPCYRAKSAQRACKRGDTARLQVQVYNEGTVALGGIQGRFELPQKHSVVSVVPSVAPSNHPDVTAITLGTWNPTTRTMTFALSGSLPPGASAQYVLTVAVAADAALSPLPLPVASPYPNEVLLRVTSVNAGMVNDLDSAWCLALTTACIGLHDKQTEPDHADFVGWSVVA